MKTLLFFFALLQLLAGCAKDKKPSATTNAQAASPGCPTLEGAYSGTDPDDGKTYTFYFSTRRDGATTSYVISKAPIEASAYYQPANGKTLQGTDTEGKEMERTMSCGTNTLTETNRVDGEAAQTVKFTDIGNNQIRIEEGGQSAVMTKG